MKTNEIIKNLPELPSGRKVLNTTPHQITFGDKEKTFVVEKSTVLVNARAVEKEIFSEDGATFVATSFQGDVGTETFLRDIREACPGIIVVGSIIAAQAYPGLVCALVPVEGFERVPPDQKRMRYDKFTIFVNS